MRRLFSIVGMAPVLHPEDTVLEAADLMRILNICAAPVIEDNKLVGTVGGRHPDRVLGGYGHDPQAWKVGDIMNRLPPFCFIGSSPRQIIHSMNAHHLDILPIVDQQMHLVGSVARDELGLAMDLRLHPAA